MARASMTEADVLREIERLKHSPYVKLAKQSEKLRDYLYQLRYHEKRGRKIAEELGLSVEED